MLSVSTALLAEPEIAPLDARPIATRSGPISNEGKPEILVTPFGPGTEIEVTVSGRPVGVYVVPLPRDRSRPEDREFKRIGMAPIAFQLPPGDYLLEAEGHGVTRGTHIVHVTNTPQRLLVDCGSESLGLTGTLLTAVGVTAILTGIVLIISGPKGANDDVDKKNFTIPLFAAGGGLLATGITFTLLSRTHIEPASSPSASSALAFASARPTKAAGMKLAFGF